MFLFNGEKVFDVNMVKMFVYEEGRKILMIE